RAAVRGLGVAGLIDFYVRRNPGKHPHGINTNTGNRLLTTMVNQVLEGEKIEDVQNSRAVRQEVALIFTESPRFFGRLLETVIQPALSQKEKETRGFIRNWILGIRADSFQWSNIQGTQSGQQVIDAVKDLLRGVIIHNRAFTQQDYQTIVALVEQAAREHARAQRRP
ncbi:MAG: hypothetical protein MJK18_06370, partial [Bdellovibrionales bacterium]|nr:hypothetical protein [Bdellovibrionales bacterium]